MRLIHCALLVSFLSFRTNARQPSTKESGHNAAPTCPSATVNYITQTLPQQCLRTDWTRPSNDEPRETTTAAASAADGTGEDQGGDTVQEEDIGERLAPTSASQTDSGDKTESIAQIHVQEPDGPKSEPEDEDGDPLSDHGNFLSFEEWKVQMLEKAGTSPDHIIGVANGAAGANENRRQHPGINNALESLGDEGEIELDFSGFVNPETAPKPRLEVSHSQETQAGDAQEDAPAPPVKRSKDAGTTSKERFNYASFDCAATVLKTNQGSKGATWILSENKDSYLINKCSEQSKHFIVELCNDILIDTIVLGNFEFFSSTFRTFRVSISDRYPVKADKWREIGTFEARNTRGIQAFLVEDGLFWARYLKVELLTHYGSEYYCPVSLLRVHGTTMVDDWRSVMKESHGQDDEDADDQLQVGSTEVVTPEVVPIPPIKTTDVQIVRHETSTSIAISTVTILDASPDIKVQHAASLDDTSSEHYARPISMADSKPPEMISAGSESTSTKALHNEDTITPAAVVTPVQAVQSITSEAPVTPHTSPSSSEEALETLTSSRNATVPIETTQMAIVNETSTVTSSSDVPPPTMLTTIAAVAPNDVNITVSIADATQSLTPTDATSMSSSSTARQNETQVKSDVKPQNATSSPSKSKNKQLSPIKAAPAAPSTQDSFFRAVHKRLQMLEANSTLSLQYIEEQSRILRDAFAKAEKKQLQKTSNFLEVLNSTVLGELRNFRVQYDQIWQSTVLELASQREQSKQEVQVLGERLGMLASELVWQKRVVYLQFVLIVLCLGLVMFSKNGVAIGASAPLDLTLLQSIQHLRRHGPSMSFSKRYPSSIDNSPPGTPLRPNSMPALFGNKAGHSRSMSDGLTSGDDVGTNPTSSPEQHRRQRLHVRVDSNGTTIASGAHSKSPSMSFGPITPASEQEDSLDAKADTEGETGIPEADLSALKRAASSPPLGRQFDTPPDDEDTSPDVGDYETNDGGLTESISAA